MMASARSWWVPAGFFLLGWLVTFGAGGPSLMTHSYGGPWEWDAGSAAWYLNHVKEAALGRGGLFFSDRMFAPLGLSMISQDWVPLVGLLALPLQPLGPVAAYNLQLVLAYLLCGWCTFALARALGASRPFAWLAGVIFAFSELHLLKAHHQGQPGHLHQQLIPLYLLLLLTYLRRGRRRHALLAGLCFWGASFVSPYQAVFLLLLTFMVATAWVLGRRRWGVAGGRGGRVTDPGPGAAAGAAGAGARRLGGFAAWSGGLVLLLLVPVVVPNWEPLVQAAGSLEITREAGQGTDLLDFARPTLGARLDPHAVLDEYRVVFMGYSVLLLTLLCLLLVRGRGGARFWLLAALGFFLLALGPELVVAGRRVCGLPLFAALQRLPLLPGFRFAPRFAAMVSLCLGLYLALALTGLWRGRLTAALPSARARTLLAVGLVALVTLELTSGRLLQHLGGEAAPRPLPQGAANRIIAAEPGDRAVLSYPVVWEARAASLGGGAFPSCRLHAYQLQHGKPMLGGFGDFVPAAALEDLRQTSLLRRLERVRRGLPLSPPSPKERREVGDLVRRLDLGFVLLHKKPVAMAPSTWDYHPEQARRELEGLLEVERVHEDDQALLLRLKTAP